MNILKLTFVFLLIAAISYSQNSAPTISNSIIPQVGDKYITVVGDTSDITSIDSGENKIWDFSLLRSLNIYDTTEYIDPSITLYTSYFPTASLADYKDNIYTYYSNENNSWNIIGTASSENINTKRVSILNFPINLNSQYLYNDSSIYIDNLDTIKVKISGVSKADSYGTLITPSGTFSNSIRIKTSTALISSYENKNIKQITTTYSWVCSGQTQHVMIISFRNYFEDDILVFSDEQVSYKLP